MLWPWVVASVAIHGLVLSALMEDKHSAAGGDHVVEVALSADRSGTSEPVERRIEKRVIRQHESFQHPERQVVQQGDRPAAEKPTAVEGEATSVAGRSASHDLSASELSKRESLVRNHLEQFKYYPTSARRRGIVGEVEVAFKLSARGQASMLKVLTASGYRVLDDAALDAVRRAAPFPAENGRFHFRLIFRTAS